jgi:hypothetical protein
VVILFPARPFNTEEFLAFAVSILRNRAIQNSVFNVIVATYSGIRSKSECLGGGTFAEVHSAKVHSAIGSWRVLPRTTY